MSIYFFIKLEFLVLVYLVLVILVLQLQLNENEMLPLKLAEKISTRFCIFYFIF